MEHVGSGRTRKRDGVESQGKERVDDVAMGVQTMWAAGSSMILHEGSLKDRCDK